MQNPSAAFLQVDKNQVAHDPIQRSKFNCQIFHVGQSRVATDYYMKIYCLAFALGLAEPSVFTSSIILVTAGTEVLIRRCLDKPCRL